MCRREVPQRRRIKSLSSHLPRLTVQATSLAGRHGTAAMVTQSKTRVLQLPTFHALGYKNKGEEGKPDARLWLLLLSDRQKFVVLKRL